MEECIVIEPIRLLFTEGAIIRIVCTRLAEHAECLFQQILFELLDPLKVNECGICLVRKEEVLFRQPAACGKLFKIDHHDIARKGRDRLIGRVGAADRTERQDLPDLLPRLRKEVEEAVCLPAEVADAVLRRQRGRMQEDPRLALVAARFLALAQEESEQRRDLDAQMSALDLVGA